MSSLIFKPFPIDGLIGRSSHRPMSSCVYVALIGRAAANFRGGGRHDDVRHARAGAKDWSDRLMVGVIVAVLAYALSSLYS